jgi:hypothetical protein
MSDYNDIASKCNETILNLLQKYNSSEYMLQRIQNHIINYLPNTLDNEQKNYEKRINRNTFLTNEQQNFIQVFLSKNNFYYLPNNNFFYEYDGEKYKIVKEDDVIHKLLSTISKDRVLMQWKYKTKINVIKLIKERSLFSCVPETDTIQNVLNVLYPTFFSSKNAAKYFLTVIGDNILKKSQNLIFLVSQKVKQFTNELENVAISSIGYSNATSNFMTKYHENNTYEFYRLIKINENVTNDVWRELLKRIGLDLLCVAVHYSKCYDNSDKFIESKADDELKAYTYYVKNTNSNAIVLEFCDKYINQDTYTADLSIEWKNLHFVWKQFLSNNNLPSVIYSNNLKNMLKERYNYNESLDSFYGITSKHIPIHSDFIKFWENSIIVTATDNNSLFDNEFEIDELCSLFKLWAKNNQEQIKTNGNISEENILKILKHFYPNIEIIEDKFVLNITCSLWDKTKNINDSLTYIKEQILLEKDISIIPFDTIYGLYCKYSKSIASKHVVSKRYFEKYLYNKYSEFVAYDKFFKIDWINT